MRVQKAGVIDIGEDGFEEFTPTTAASLASLPEGR